MNTLKGFNFGSGDWALFESFLREELQLTLKSFMKQGISTEEMYQLRGRAGAYEYLLNLKNQPLNRPQD